MLRGCWLTARHFAMAMLCLILLLCGAEVAVRLAEVRQKLHQPGRSLAASQSNSLTVPSWTTYTQLPPMGILRPARADEGGLAPDHRIEINRLGYRGPVHSTSLNRTSYRVLVLGDESLFGALLPEETLATHQLARSLATSSTAPIEIINGSWPAATPTMQLIALRTHWASLAPQLVVLQVSSQRLQREARLRRFVRLDSTGLPAACPHPSLSSAANQSTLKTCQEHFRVLHWIMHWGGAAWQQSVEEADTTRGATADEELFDTPWRLSSSAWHQWSREAGIPVVLLATPTAAERAAKQHSATSAPHWLKIVLSSATEHHWTTCVAGQQRQPGSKTRSRTEALTQWQTLVANSLEDSFRQQVAGPWNTQAETTRLANQSDGFATQHDHGFPPQLPTTVEDGPSAATALMVFPPPTGGRSNLSFSDTTSIEPTSYRESTNDRIAAPGAPRSLPTDDWATPPPVEEPQSHQPAQLSPPRQPAQQGSNRGRTLKPRAPASVEQSYRPPQ